MSSQPLSDFATHVELIDIIQSFCAHEDLLALTSVNKRALATRFCNSRLQKLFLKTVDDTKQFLFYCQAILEQEITSRQLDPALSFDTTTRFIPFAREHLRKIKVLTLTLSDQFTAEQYDLLFTYLPGIQHLTINLTTPGGHLLALLLNTTQRLTLHNLTISNFSPSVADDDEYEDENEIAEDNLPDELWQLTTLETLTIRDCKDVVSIPEGIGQLSALKALTLDNVDSLETLPASLWQLNKLEALTLKRPYFITTLSEDIGQLTALKSLTLQNMPLLNALPASLWQLDKLEVLTLRALQITALPEDIGQLNALKSLTLNTMPSLNVLPASLWQLDKLEALTLKGLWVTALPEDIGQLTALKLLTLQRMQLFKALPIGLRQLNKLEALTLNDLPITALPDEMGQLKALKVVELINMKRLETLPGKLAQIVVRK
jgi:hypothetical protein